MGASAFRTVVALPIGVASTLIVFTANTWVDFGKGHTNRFFNKILKQKKSVRRSTGRGFAQVHGGGRKVHLPCPLQELAQRAVAVAARVESKTILRDIGSTGKRMAFSLKFSIDLIG